MKRFLLITVLVLLLTGCKLGRTTKELLDTEQALDRWRWFYDAHEALEAMSGNIELAEKHITEYIEINGDTKDWDWQQRSEYQRLTSVRDGYITNYNNLANKYNAKMRDITRGLVSPPDLPNHIKNWGEE